MLSKQQLTFALSLKRQEELIQQLMKEAQQGMKNQADRGGCYPRWITPFEVCLILHTLRKPNSLITLLFIQNNSQLKNHSKNMLTCIDIKFIFDSVRLGLSSLHTAYVALRVVFLLCFQLLFRLVPAVVLTLETSEVSAIFCFHNQNNSTSSPGLLGNGAFTCSGLHF